MMADLSVSPHLPCAWCVLLWWRYFPVSTNIIHVPCYIHMVTMYMVDTSLGLCQSGAGLDLRCKLIHVNTMYNSYIHV